MGQFAVRFEQALFEFLKQSHESGRRSGGRLGAAGLLEFLQVNGRELDPADEGFAFAEAVAIGAAGDGQIEAPGQGQIVFALGGGVFGMETFQAVQTLAGQCGMMWSQWFKPGWASTARPPA